MTKFNVIRAFKILFITGLTLLMAGSAFGQYRDGDRTERRERIRQYIQQYTETHVHTRTCGHRVRPRPTSGVPEPSAALLFATGGLIVAHTVRKKGAKKS